MFVLVNTAINFLVDVVAVFNHQCFIPYTSALMHFWTSEGEHCIILVFS